jgi:flagellar assembly protein FliH
MKMNSSIKNDGDMKKFLFDKHDFDREREEAAKPVFTEEQLILAKMQAQAQGKAEGMKEAKQAQEEQISKSLQQIGAACEKLIAAEDRREVEQMISATKLAMQIAHKLLPQFAQRFSLQEIERVVLLSIETRREEPRIAVIVPTQHLETLRQKIDNLAAEKGYGGKLILIADDNLAQTDVRVEWADGGAERLYERLFSQVEGEFAKAIAGMQATIKDTKN